MQNISYKRGFTLLELLVVLAIIAVIATILVSFMGESKDKGGDAGVKQNLVNARSQISTYYLNNDSSYANACLNATVRRMVQAAAKAGGLTPKAGAYANTDVGSWNVEACHSNATAWAVWVPLKGSANGASLAWCIDSTNISKQVSGSSLANGAVACP